MEETAVLQYVKAAAQAAGLALDEQRAASIAQHFARTVAIARLLEQAELAPDDEPAETFRPAPFPAEDA